MYQFSNFFYQTKYNLYFANTNHCTVYLWKSGNDRTNYLTFEITYAVEGQKSPLCRNMEITDVTDFQPSGYISHLIGHEGPGSLLSALKLRGWSNHLVAGNRPAARGMGFFGISVDLTEVGINHVDDIIELVFQVSIAPHQ